MRSFEYWKILNAESNLDYIEIETYGHIKKFSSLNSVSKFFVIIIASDRIWNWIVPRASLFNRILDKSNSSIPFK